MLDSDCARRAVFLDRDGVVNKPRMVNGVAHPPRTVAELELTEGIREVLQALKGAGFLLVVVTNQPDVARGTLTFEAVEAVHARLAALLPIDAFYCCPHDDEDGCGCRKPKPGLLLRAAQEWGIDLRASFMVGDRWRDVDAGRAAGCTTVFVDYGYHEALRSPADITVQAPAEIAACILNWAARV
ncbi:MAG: HAD family hydrolase [bacterium]|nr:HAD family hydrolase [bacterium]